MMPCLFFLFLLLSPRDDAINIYVNKRKRAFNLTFGRYANHHIVQDNIYCKTLKNYIYHLEND